MAASRAGEMPLRSRSEINRQQHGADMERTKGASRHAVTSSTSSESPTPEVIECRKKNSKGESVVTHRYYKGRLLGKGGFAHCYKVTCVDTMRVYAMKIVPKSTLTKARARQKLQTEIKIHRTLAHPRIVRFEMFFEDRDNVYILLELCANHSLSELIRKTKRFAEDEARRYMLQILEATSYLHRHQIIHRDLKLGNVFLDKDWNVKMGDFGLATKLVQDSERKRTICGTPNYIAPEILEGTAGHSYQVDLWSAGVILYTMLVGRPPYESTDVKSTYRRILANVYAFPDTVPISDSAKNLVGRLLQVKPELRPSLDEILDHPFLRNGGPPQRFSTVHGLRGPSTSSSAAATVPTTSAGVATSATVSASRGGQKLTPERGVGGRPPLKARSANVDTTGGIREARQAESAQAGGARASVASVQANAARAAADGAGGKFMRSSASGVAAGPKQSSGAPRPVTSTVSPSASIAVASSATSPALRTATSRKTNGKAFDIFCDDRSGSGATRGGVRSIPNSGRTSPGASTAKRPSPPTGRRRESTAANTGAPGDDKENDPRAVFGGTTRVPVRGTAARRPLVRAASTVGGGEVRSARLATGVANGTGGAMKGTGARKMLLRSTSSVAGGAHAAAEGRVGVTTRSAAAAAAATTGAKPTMSTGVGLGLGNVVTSATAPIAASPRVRPARRSVGASRSPATAGAYPPPRSSPGAVAGGVGGAKSIGGATGTNRPTGNGERVTPPPASRVPRAVDAQEGLDSGGTPGSSSKKQQPSGAGVLSGTRLSTRLLKPATSITGTGIRTRSQSALRSTDISPSRTTKPVSRDRTDAASSPAQVPSSATAPPSQAPSSTVASPAQTPSSAAAPPSQRRSHATKSKRDTLETMHDLLTRSFAVDTDEGARNAQLDGSSEAGGRMLGNAGAAAEVGAGMEVETPPLVWVTRYVDYSSKYGLGFLLSDGSAGVYFNDATKIVLDPAGVEFEYIERARRSTLPTSAEDADAGERKDDGRRDEGDQPPRMRYTLHEFPPELQKKVTLLNHFRGYLQELVKKDEGTGGSATSAAAAAAAKVAAAAAAAKATAAERDLQPRVERIRHTSPPLTFLKKWLRTRNAILFRLSNRTVQVVFSDHTEILLSKEARVVTYVDKDGNRETHALQKILQEQRTDVTKRVRYCKELIAQLVRRV